MEYKPSELAEELGVNVLTVYRRYIPAGCPHRKDEHGQIWIHGESFAVWAQGIHKQERAKKDKVLQSGEGWCLTCKKVVVIQNPHTRPLRGKAGLMEGICPVCGRKVTRTVTLGAT
jgi:endogenous inhibitor of DNA gyrase (YacG/DUF329 family)